MIKMRLQHVKVDKSRFLRVVHSWRQQYLELQLYFSKHQLGFDKVTQSRKVDVMDERVIEMIYFSERMLLVEMVAKETDDFLYPYILKAVIDDVSYTNLKTQHHIPCSRDVYYENYRKFFYILSQRREQLSNLAQIFLSQSRLRVRNSFYYERSDQYE